MVVQAFALLSLTVASCGSPDRVVAPCVAITSLGKVVPEEISEAVSAIRSLGLTVIVLQPHELPKSAFYAPRNRYRADKLLMWSRGIKTGQAKLLMITDVDISTTSRGHTDWGVFGLAEIGGTPCVVSTYRFRNRGAMVIASRLRKIVVHEVGHTLGLAHCSTQNCVMHDAEASITTIDRVQEKYCSKCRTKLPASLH